MSFDSDRYDRENDVELERPVLLLAEGKSDVSFLMSLCIDTHGLDSLHFGFPSEKTGGHGKDAIGKYLTALTVRAGFDALRSVVVVFDNNSDPVSAFRDVKRMAGQSSYTAAAEPMTLGASDGDKVRLMFMPMPGIGEHGALETLLIRSVEQDCADLLQCIDSLSECSGSESWNDTHKAKMRLRCLIAATCQGNSDVTLTHIWNKPGNRINLQHECFEWVVSAVKTVVETVK